MSTVYPKSSKHLHFHQIYCPAGSELCLTTTRWQALLLSNHRSQNGTCCEKSCLKHMGIAWPTPSIKEPLVIFHPQDMPAHHELRHIHHSTQRLLAANDLFDKWKLSYPSSLSRCSRVVWTWPSLHRYIQPRSNTDHQSDVSLISDANLSHHSFSVISPFCNSSLTASRYGRVTRMTLSYPNM